MPFQDIKKQFLLLSTPRAGTHMVRSTLDQHPQVCCYGEVFHTKFREWYPECSAVGVEEIEQWMRESTTKPVCGFAVQIGSPITKETKDFWALTDHDPWTPVVYVLRRNQLRQTLSLYRSEAANKRAKGGYMSYRKGTKDFDRFGWTSQGLERLGSIHVDCEEFHDRTVEREANEVMFFTQRKFRSICPVAYEDFVDDSARELKRISQFLQVEEFMAEPQTQKTGEASLRQLIENFDEFHEFFSQTPYRRWLSDNA